MKVTEIEKMDDWRAGVNKVWHDLGLLHRAGHQLKAAATEFLPSRVREHGDIYDERIANFTYQPVLPSVTGWYSSAVGKRPVSLSVMDGERRLDVDGYWRWLEARLRAILPDVVADLLVYKHAYVAVVAPRAAAGSFASRLQQEQAGGLDYDLRVICPEHIVSFKTAKPGDRTAERVVIQTGFEREKRSWSIYTAENSQEVVEGKNGDVVEGEPVDHAGSGVGLCPIIRIEASTRFWLGDRVYLELLDHLRVCNGLSWSLDQSCYPIPWIKASSNNIKTLTPSATTYLLLEKDGGDAGFLETGGVSYTHSAARAAVLRESIYRSCYLVAQGRDSADAPAMQSGYSKELDQAPADDVLTAVGDMMRDAFQALVDDLLAMRGERMLVAVGGLDFGEEKTAEADSLSTLRDLGIASPTARRVLERRLVRKLLSGEPAQVIEAAELEVEQSSASIDMGDPLSLRR